MWLLSDMSKPSTTRHQPQGISPLLSLNVMCVFCLSTSSVSQASCVSQSHVIFCLSYVIICLNLLSSCINCLSSRIIIYHLACIMLCIMYHLFLNLLSSCVVCHSTTIISFISFSTSTIQAKGCVSDTCVSHTHLCTLYHVRDTQASGRLTVWTIDGHVCCSAIKTIDGHVHGHVDGLVR